jgi:hypothetical protein
MSNVKRMLMSATLPIPRCRARSGPFLRCSCRRTLATDRRGSGVDPAGQRGQRGQRVQRARQESTATRERERAGGSGVGWRERFGSAWNHQTDPRFLFLVLRWWQRKSDAMQTPREGSRKGQPLTVFLVQAETRLPCPGFLQVADLTGKRGRRPPMTPPLGVGKRGLPGPREGHWMRDVTEGLPAIPSLGKPRRAHRQPGMNTTSN